MTLHINNISLFLIIPFAIINIIAFFIMLLDKRRSTYGDDNRISEGVMFFWATIFGGLGIYLGMLAVRHKTHKWYFRIGMPLIIIENIVFLLLLYRFLAVNT